jgi:hypothetical protein
MIGKDGGGIGGCKGESTVFFDANAPFIKPECSFISTKQNCH